MLTDEDDSPGLNGHDMSMQSFQLESSLGEVSTLHCPLSASDVLLIGLPELIRSRRPLIHGSFVIVVFVACR